MSRNLSLVHKIPLAQRACLPALAPDTIRRAALMKEEQSLTQCGGTQPQSNVALSEIKKRCRSGEILHSFMGAWTTTSSSVMRTPFVFLYLCAESPCQPTEHSMCWSFRRGPYSPPSLFPPTGHPRKKCVAGCTMKNTWSNCTACLCSTVVRLHPRVSPDIFIDDPHQSAQGTPREAKKLIVAAGRTFTKEAQKQLRARFAEKKRKENSDCLVRPETVGLGGRCECW